MFQAFHLMGLTTSFLLRPTHINYISLYALNRESFIRGRAKYELTTHSVKPGKNTNFWIKGKKVISVKKSKIFVDLG